MFQDIYGTVTGIHTVGYGKERVQKFTGGIFGGGRACKRGEKIEESEEETQVKS